MLTITEFWNKVIDDKNSPFGRRVLKGEYEVRREYHVDNTLKELKKRWKGNKFMEFHKDYIKEDRKSAPYGIHSYTIIQEV